MSRYEYVDSQKAEPTNRNPVVKMCRWLDVSTSGFHHWRTRPQSATAARRETLLARIRHYFEESEGTYRYRRIHADLTAEQTQCSPELVRQLMRQEGLVACQPRPFRVTTQADAMAAANMPDLLTRDFTAERPGVKFVGDITYIHTWQGFIYLATVIDCFSKKVVGWSIADHMRTELVADALKNAAATTLIEPDAVFHTDRGSVYTSTDFRALVAGLGMRSSMGRTGVLGQQYGGIVLLDAQKRARLPDRLRHQSTRSQRHHPLHRGVLQQSTPALSARLPTPQRSPLWLSTASLGSIKESTNSTVRNPRSSPVTARRSVRLERCRRSRNRASPGFLGPCCS